MALDFYSDEINENLAKLKPVQDIEPGVFDNFAKGAGMATMKGLGEVARAGSMLQSVYPIIADKIMGGTTLQDRYFKWHDETFNSAVDYWTPRPNEVGVAGEVVGKLTSMLPLIMAGPGGVTAAIATTQLGTAEDLVRKHSDVSATQANVVGALQGAGLATGIWMPILGQNLVQRVVIGGAGFNVAQGVITRAASGAVLSDSKAAKEFEAFDGKALTIDILLGLAFGGIAHYVPTQRAQGAEAWGKIRDWAKTLKPSDIDALLVLREGQHINQDSLPGKPVTPADVSAHVERIRTAIDQLASDRPVNVEDIKVSRGTSENTSIESMAKTETGLTDGIKTEDSPRGFEVGQVWESTGRRRQEYTVLSVSEDGKLAQVDFGKGDPVAVHFDAETANGWRPVQQEAAARPPEFEVDPAKVLESERISADMMEAARRVRLEEGLPRPPEVQTIPPKDITPLPPLEQARAVGQHIERMLLETGMQTKEATANAAIWEAFAKSAYERHGIPPAELLTKYGVDVRRMDSADKLLGALEQRYNQINTPEFKRWFGDSKVVDTAGKPLVVYHGAPDVNWVNSDGVFKTSMEKFAKALTDAGKQRALDERAYFFTSDKSTANTYAKNKPAFDYQNSDRGVIPLYLSLQKPKVIDAAGAAWGGPKAQADAIAEAKASGHDGIIIRDTRDTYNATKSGPIADVYVAFKPEQIKSATGNRGTFDPKNPNILFQSAKVTESPAFKAWFEGSVITESGQPGDAPKRLYHGAKRLDRMGPKIDPKRATSGPMPYFTDSPEIASKYATSKQDTSLALEDATNYEKWFRVKVPGYRNAVDLDRAWFSLSSEQKAKIAELAPQIGKTDDGSEIVLITGNKSGTGGYDQHIKEARGNHLKALMEEWLTSGNLYNSEIEFMQVLKLAGMDMAKVEMHDPWAEFPGVLPVFMSMKKPLYADAVTPEVVTALEEAVKRTRRGMNQTGDMWDKNRQSAKEWVQSLKDDLAKGENSYVWTSIPDRITAELKKLGFDGIIDTGGKGGGPGHTVYIPFGPGQVKSAIGNRGTFDPNSPNVLFQDQPFYSQLTRSVEALKTTAAPAKGWKDTIKGLVSKGQVKQAEIEATGLNEWLDLQQGKVTKQQVQDYLAQNGVKVEEVELGAPNPELATLQARRDEISNEIQKNNFAFQDSGYLMRDVHVNHAQREAILSELDPKYRALFDANQALRTELTAVMRDLEAVSGERSGDTKFGNYQLPGGENYRELLLTLPSDVKPEDRGTAYARDHSNDFRSSHFDQPNILSHIRFNERTDADGKKVLFIEEIQSDWAQKGKKEGFSANVKDLPSGFKVIKDGASYEVEGPDGKRYGVGAVNEAQAVRNTLSSLNAGVPSAPFVGKTEAWVALSLKRMIRYAAENGFDRVAWTTGEQQAARYDLSKQVDSIVYAKEPDGTYSMVALKDGRELVKRDTLKESDLEGLVGKDMAKKIVDGEGKPIPGGPERELSGVDLKVGGEGMKAFYDKIVPNVANDVLKKLGGGRVGKIKIGDGNDNWQIIDATDDGGGQVLQDGFATKEQALEAQKEYDGGTDVVNDKSAETQAGFDITPALREKAMAGVPLFQGGARGSATSFSQTGQSLIHLFENADRSTFMHETGHVFLEMTRDMAMRDGVPVGAVQDWATLAKWLGIEGGPITREAHEKFARGWEKYLAEGVAPNEGLKGAFRRFRDWLIDIYKSLTNMDVELNNQIRGVMARMLESQAKDPISKGGLEDPRLLDPEYRAALDMMARESGWAEEGGRIIRDPMTGEVSGRTNWIAHAEWYQRLQQDEKARLPGGRKGVERAVQKAVMGEPMSVQEKRAVTFMLDEHKMLVDHWNESGANIHPDGDPFEIANLQHAEGIEPTAKNTLDMALIDRARQVDPEALENIPTNSDDATFMAAVKEIVDAHKPTPQKTDQGGEEVATEAQAGHVGPQEPAAGSPPPPGGEATGGAAAPDMAATEARRIAMENPDMKVRVGTDADGTPVYRSLNDLLDDAAIDVQGAEDGARLIAVAAECLMGVA